MYNLKYFFEKNVSNLLFANECSYKHETRDINAFTIREQTLDLKHNGTENFNFHSDFSNLGFECMKLCKNVYSKCISFEIKLHIAQ